MEGHLLADLGWVESWDLRVPSLYPAPMPMLPNSHLPQQELAYSGIPITKKKEPTPRSDVSPCTVNIFIDLLIFNRGLWSQIIRFIITAIFDLFLKVICFNWFQEEEEQKRNVAFFFVGIVTMMLGSYAVHCVWATSEAYSSPSIVLSARSHDGTLTRTGRQGN